MKHRSMTAFASRRGARGEGPALAAAHVAHLALAILLDQDHGGRTVRIDAWARS